MSLSAPTNKTSNSGHSPSSIPSTYSSIHSDHATPLAPRDTNVECLHQNHQMMVSTEKAPPPRIKPGQYSRQTPIIPPRSYSPDKRVWSEGSLGTAGSDQSSYNHVYQDNANHPQESRGRRDGNYALAKSQPLVDPKFRLRGNSPEQKSRDASSSIFRLRNASSSSPTKKGAKSRSRSRSRLFGKDKDDDYSKDQQPKTKPQIDADFVQLLDEMQTAPDLRKKLMALDTAVKASMLRAQETLNFANFGFGDATLDASSKMRKPIPDRFRHNRTSSMFEKTTDSSADDRDYSESGPLSPILGFAQKANGKRASIDVFQSIKAGILQPNLGQGGSVLSLHSSSTSHGTRGRSMSFAKDLTAQFGKETPENFATLLQATQARHLDVARVKRMRAVVASESPIWISQFIGPECGGYDALLLRLNELLKMEWREEQHDDMLLHELLRCFVALSTTEVGKSALHSRAPDPFKELVDLLFSEKKPGDLSTRKLIVDLLFILLDLQPAEVTNSLGLVLKLIQNPTDPAKEAVIDFIKNTHTPRPFKTYLIEVAGVCRDYFWIFCHSQNWFWRFDELDVESIQCPKVPGGMTGGVEFEAMSYLTAHFKLINSIAAALLQTGHLGNDVPMTMTACEFHTNLFASGIERILATLRRSSQHYYSPMHLELSRYLSLAQQAKYMLPLHLTDWLKPSNNPNNSTAYQIGQIHSGGYGYSGQFIDIPTAPARSQSESSLQDQVGGVKVIKTSNQPDTDEDRRQPYNFHRPPGAASPQKRSSATVDPQTPRPTVQTSPTKITKDPSPTSPSKRFSSGRWLSGGGGEATPTNEADPIRSPQTKTESARPLPEPQQRQPSNLSSAPSPPPVSNPYSPVAGNDARLENYFFAPPVLSPPAMTSHGNRVASHGLANRKASVGSVDKVGIRLDERVLSSLPHPAGSKAKKLIKSPPPPSAAPPGPREMRGGSSQFPNPFANANGTPIDLAPIRPSNNRNGHDSIVGTAIKKWESRVLYSDPTSPPLPPPVPSSSSSSNTNTNTKTTATGLGLGWAVTNNGYRRGS